MKHRPLTIWVIATATVFGASAVHAADASGVNAARQQVYAARAGVWAEGRKLNEARRRMDAAFLESARWKDAVDELKQSQDELATAKREALESVHGDSAYQARRLAIQSAELRFDELRANKEANDQDIFAAARELLRLRNAQSAAEAKALSADAVIVARDALVQASVRVQRLRAQHEESVRSNSEIASARGRLDAAKANMSTATIALDRSASQAWRAERQRLTSVLGLDRMNFVASP